MNETSNETRNAFIEGANKAMQPKNSDVFIRIDSRKATAKLDVYNHSEIGNAYICIKQNHSSMIWSVQNGRGISAPATLWIWIKSPQKLGIGIGNSKTSETQFILNNGKDFFFLQDFSIHGFIENQEYGLAFFFSSDKQVITQDENTNNGFSPICALLTLFMQDKDNSSMKENKNGHENDYMDPSFR